MTNPIKLEDYAPPVELTENGVARGFTLRHAHRLLFDHEAGAWFEWKGERWTQGDGNAALEPLRELVEEATAPLKPREQKPYRSRSFIGGAEYLARNDPRQIASAGSWDRNPWLLGCPGATVDLRTGEARGPDPADRITRLAAVAPAARADCPLWLAFLDQATGGNAGMAEFLRRWCGYCLTGDTREHALIFLYGPGGNGKSVFVNTVASILGEYAATSSMDAFTASNGDRHSTDLAMLRGARLVTSSETNAGRSWDEARIKQMSGGDSITARFMRQDFFTFTPQFKLAISGNHHPRMNNPDAALRRRFNIVPFTHTPAVPDRELEAKLKEEWPGILRWMVEGCVAWHAALDLARPGVVTAATDELFHEQDVVGQWFDEACEVEPGNDARRTPTARVWESWRGWAQVNGHRERSTRWLGEELKRRGVHNNGGTPVWHNGKAARCWFGVSVRGQADVF